MSYNLTLVRGKIKDQELFYLKKRRLKKKSKNLNYGRKLMERDYSSSMKL